MRMSITIEFEILDEKTFRETAKNTLIEQGLEEESAIDYLDPEKSTLEECAIAIFDPGSSPDGTAISESFAKVFND